MNEIVTVAERLIPLIWEHRHTTEQDRRVAEPIVQAIRESALPGRVVVCPRGAGGLRSIGVLAHLEQHPALFLGPLPR